MKYFFSNLYLVFISVGIFSTSYEAHSQISKPIQIGDWGTRYDGSLMSLQFRQAVYYCAQRGQRLPTVQEIAQIGVSKGAKGIVSTPNDYTTKVKVKNSDGTIDFFLYDWRGYRWTEFEHDFSHGGFWTSSEDPDDPSDIYTMNVRWGEISWHGNTNGDTNIFFCIKD